MPKYMRFGNKYDKKKGPKRPFKKCGKSEDGVRHYIYSVAGKTRT
jgi:hypothetical protein